MAAPTCYIPTQQSDAAAGLTGNKVDQHQHHHAAAAAAAAAPAPPTSTSSTPQHHSLQQQQQPLGHESKSFCPSENKEPDGSKAYGTFKSAAPPVPVPVNSAFRKDSSSSCPPSSGAARAGSVQYGEPLHNNTAAGSHWTAMSQTTIILGTDGNTSVQASAAAGVSAGEPGARGGLGRGTAEGCLGVPVVAVEGLHGCGSGV